jgi:hypothetical protein
VARCGTKGRRRGDRSRRRNGGVMDGQSRGRTTATNFTKSFMWDQRAEMGDRSRRRNGGVVDGRSRRRTTAGPKVSTHSVWQLSRNTAKFLSESLHMIPWHVDKFHDFLTLFVLYIILKQLDRNFMVMFREHGARKFRSVPEIGRNLC